MSRKYPQAKDGEWLVPRKRGYKLICCDCGLAHTLDFKIFDGNRITYRATRDNRATANIRRHLKRRA